MECNIGKIPEGSRIERYLIEFSLVVKNEKDIDEFIRMVVNDSISFLEQELGANFPIIILKKCYNSQEFDRLWSETGISGKRPTAFIVHSPFGLTPAQVVIDLQKLLSYNAESFVLNFVLTILEELLHSVYPLNTESQTHKLLYPLAEEFLSIKLPEEYKNFNIDE